MPKQSAGILMYRIKKGLELFLVHPGGPFFRNRDAGSWSVPKGEFSEAEEPLNAAIREFEEETGYRPEGKFLQLTAVRQKGHKTVYCWAVEDDMDAASIVSNTFEIEWPPKSGKKQAFPEIDRAAWFPAAEARIRINERQVALIEELEQLLSDDTKA